MAQTQLGLRAAPPGWPSWISSEPGQVSARHFSEHGMSSGCSAGAEWLRLVQRVQPLLPWAVLGQQQLCWVTLFHSVCPSEAEEAMDPGLAVTRGSQACALTNDLRLFVTLST